MFLIYYYFFLLLVLGVGFWWIFAHRLVLKKWFVIVFAPPGNCKSLEQALLSYKLLKEYGRLEKRYPQLPRRFLWTNQILNSNPRFRLSWNQKRKGFLIKQALADGHLKYWSDPEEIQWCPRENCWKGTARHFLHDCDLFADEGATLFPATYKGAKDDLPDWGRAMLTQHRHRGVRILLLTVDFMAINITARRCAWVAWAMEKKIGSRDPSPSLPPVRKIWGFYVRRKIDPDLARRDAVDLRLLIKVESGKDPEQQDDRMILVGMPRLRWISRFKCSLYDTLQDINYLRDKK